MVPKKRKAPSLSDTKKANKKKKEYKKNELKSAANLYEALSSSESDPDSNLVYNFDAKKEPQVQLADSDDSKEKDDDNDGDESVVFESDKEEGEGKGQPILESEEPAPKKQKTERPNELAGNQDFIEFDAGSSDEEDNRDDYEYSDDGILSDDASEKVYMKDEPKTPYPWIQDHDHSKQKEIADWLTLEMKGFVKYISPSREEIIMRNNVIRKLKELIHSFWPDTEVHIFGSSATDLYLPGSDIDMVIISRNGDYENRGRLYQLSSFLRNKSLAKNIEVIAKAKVPIVKFCDPPTNVQVDVSFERINGIEAAKRIREWLHSTPGLRELVLVVKQFLRSRKLNNVHIGGLGGYSTIIMCYHFLKLHPRVNTNNMNILDNLGALLIEFFELYGNNFSYDNLIIAIEPETNFPKYLPKKNHPELNTSRNPFSIIIRDPSDTSNNISRSSYNLRDIKKAFGGAFQLLLDKCYRLNAASYKARIGQLILGDIIKYKGKQRDFSDDRDKVTNHAHIDNISESDLARKTPDEDDERYFSETSIESDQSAPISQTPAARGKKAEDFMSLNPSGTSESETLENEAPEEEENEDMNKLTKSVNKDAKREYWLQKGLEL